MRLSRDVKSLLNRRSKSHDVTCEQPTRSGAADQLHPHRSRSLDSPRFTNPAFVTHPNPLIRYRQNALFRKGFMTLKYNVFPIQVNLESVLTQSVSQIKK